MKGMERSLSRGRPQVSPITRFRIPVKAKQFNVTDVAAAAGWGTFVAGGLPEGNVLMLGAVAYLDLTVVSGGITATFAPTISMGTAATADNALAGAEINIAAAQAGTVAVASKSTASRVASAAAESGVMHDNTAKTLNVNVNVTIADAGITANGVLQADGYIDVACIVLGDD